MIKLSNVTTIYTKSGLSVWLRPLQSDDTPLLVDIFEHMSSESRYQRFHQTLDHVSEQRIQKEAKQIAQADPLVNQGIIAFADTKTEANTPIGAARWVETGSREAEIAISIRDDFQNQGIGKQLLRLLIDEAKQTGYNRLTAEVSNTNSAIWHILSNLPYSVNRQPKGNESNVVINLA